MRILFLLLTLALTPTLQAADFLGELPPMSTIMPGYGATDSVEARLGCLPLCPAEGIWQMADDGALFAIERADDDPGLAPARLRIIMIRSPWRSIRPGTVLGHAVPTPKPGVYEARMYSSMAQRTGLNLPRKFLLSLNSESNLLTIEPFRSPVKLSLFRLLPYLYRRIVTLQDSRPKGLDGAVRVFPAEARHPLTPVYL